MKDRFSNLRINDQSGFVDVKGYEGYYVIDINGTVISKHNHYYNRKLTIQIDRKGYSKVSLQIDKKNKYILLHRLVAKNFIPNDNPLLDQIDHIDGIKSNNHASNLRWVTSKQNINYGWDNKLFSKRFGEKNFSSKLTERNVLDIREKRKKGMELKQLAKEYNVCEATISLIYRKKLWTHI